MYSSSTSSSSQGNSLGPSNGSGLVRYGSAPSSLLSTAVDSIMNPDGGEFSGYGLHMGPSSHAPPSTSRLFFSSSETSPQQAALKTSDHNTNGGLQRAYGFAGSSAPPPPPLVRHRSSPAGFLNQLAHAACTSNDENGFSTARAHGVSRLNSQMSFTRQDALSLISEESEDEANEKRKLAQYNNSGSYGGGGTSWEDPHTIMFSVGPSKRPKDISTGLNGMESQIQFGMPETMLEMASMDKLLNIPEDSVPCKIRAKRGCATHPRSIAERERRTRISGKLKKLHDLVPNMDKQTSYADMLDLAVQHIKGLQDHVQKLNSELDNCTCGCRRPNNDSGEERR